MYVFALPARAMGQPESSRELTCARTHPHTTMKELRLPEVRSLAQSHSAGPTALGSKPGQSSSWS